MGPFDSAMDGPTPEELDATIQAAVLGAYVDGTLAQEERDVLCECIGTYAESEAQAKSMIGFAKRLPHKMASMSPAALEQRLGELNDILRTRRAKERAFALAVDVTAAHQGIGTREMRYLMTLVTQFQLEPAYARALVESGIRKFAARSNDPAAVEKTLRSALDTLSDHFGS